MTDTNAHTDRRNRYDAAIREAEGWVLDGGQRMLDAVIAVADAEQDELRRALAQAAATVPASAPTDQAAPCVCGEPTADDTVHRTDGPCFADNRVRVIALAIARVDAGKWGTEVPLEDHPFWQAYLAYAAAVLAVLPAPADRAALLRETADAYDAIINKSTGKEADPRYWSGVHDVAVGLRAMADAVPVSGPGGAADETRAEPVDRAAIEAAALRNAADRYATLADQNEAYDREHGDLDEAARIQHGTVRDVAIGLRRMADEAQQSTSCSARPCNPAADELCDAHAQIRYHAEGEHAFCGPECTEEPSS